MDTLINIILVNIIVLSLVDGVFRAYDSNYTFLFEVLLLVHYCVQITCCRGIQDQMVCVDTRVFRVKICRATFGCG